MNDQASIYDLYDGTPPHESALTSVLAAESIVHTASHLQALLLQAIDRYGGCTDEQLAEITRMNPSTERPRRRELELKGLIRHSGERKTRSGRLAKVWVRA